MTPRLIGMVHLAPLPGSPRFRGDLDEVVARAVDDARVLAAAGFDAVMIENFGDAPFFADDVPKITIAAMTRAVAAVGAAIPIPTGVNVLRNDALGALAIAGATGASAIRVNVLSGVMHTDQGTITGRAAEVARMRAAIAPGISVWADVFVKHATAPAGLTVEQATRDLWERAGADAIVVSGPGTGHPVDRGRLEAVRDAAPDAPLLIGSGVDADNAASLLQIAEGLIVGTSIKEGAVTSRVDAKKAEALVESTR